ncbi:hypothetical protein G4467_07560 [Blautia obeum]|nr:hypothetical protein [Blautia obeum]
MTQCAFGGGIFNTSWQDILSGLGWGLGYFGMPHILVRFMSIEKPSMIKKSSIVAIVWVIISLFSAVMIAYFGRMVMGAELLTQGNQKLVFIAMARRFFPAGICGLAAGCNYCYLYFYSRLPVISCLQFLHCRLVQAFLPQKSNRERDSVRRTCTCTGSLTDCFCNC